MAKLTFEQVAVEYFKTIPEGYVQRIDGVECFSPLSKFWFWRWRLDRLVKRGILKRHATSSIWASCNGMPAYALSPEPSDDH
jgi:hypothetical protein